MKTSREEIKQMATKLLLHWLQNWGDTIDERIVVLNEAVDFVGLNTKFIQKNENEAGWERRNPNHSQLGKQFRHDIESCWPKG
jgi:hypothetical protein